MKQRNLGKQTLHQLLENEILCIEQCLLASPKLSESWHHYYIVPFKHPTPNAENEYIVCTKYLKMADLFVSNNSLNVGMSKFVKSRSCSSFQRNWL